MKLSSHARERMAQMGVAADEVYAAVRDPEFRYHSDRGRSAEQRWVHVRGRLAVVLWYRRGDSGDGRIVTVLWHNKEGTEWLRKPA